MDDSNKIYEIILKPPLNGNRIGGGFFATFFTDRK